MPYRVSEIIPRKYIVIIGVITAAVFAVIFFSNEDKSLDTYLLGGFIITQVLLFMIDQIFQNMRGTRNDLKEHTKSINEVYKLLTLVNIREGRHGEMWKHFLTFPKEYKSSRTPYFDELEEGVKPEPLYEDQLKSDYPVYLYYESAIEHLKHKKYKGIYEHWENVKNKLDELNSKTNPKKMLEDRIKEKMSECFPDFKNGITGLKSYSISDIREFIIGYFKYADDSSDYDLKFLKYDKSNKYKEIYLSWKHNAVHIRSDSEIDFEEYKRLITEIINDDSLKNFYYEYGREHNNILEELECFQNKLKDTIKNLDIKPWIEGKCSGCP